MYNHASPKRRFGNSPRGFAPSSRSVYSTGRSFGNRKINSRAKGLAGYEISRFIQEASNQKPAPQQAIVHTFADFGFDRELNKNLEYNNYCTPTPIQDQAIGPILKGRDFIGLASTGTGKTAAFILPMINKTFLDRSQKVLIITPTRELALQIANELFAFAYGMRIYSALCVGGMPIGKQIANLSRQPQFVIGTPGRLQDLHKRGLINYGQFKNIVLDEVDRMLDMGFIDEIRDILGDFPKIRQSLFFSATLPPKIRALTDEFLDNPVTISINAGRSNENVEQKIIRADEHEKLDRLHDVLLEPSTKKVLIFSETKRSVEKLCEDLIASGFNAESIHGDKRQAQRQHALTKFKNDEVNILIATDVAARGLDIKNVSHVINYTTPHTFDDYIHRIGRTGRMNQKGVALTFI